MRTMSCKTSGHSLFTHELEVKTALFFSVLDTVFKGLK